MDHEILLAKLDHYGIRKNILGLTKFYPTDRQQYVEIFHVNNSTKNEEIYIYRKQTVEYGRGQATILDPLLFISVIDLLKVTDHQITIYADDSIVTIECRNE